MQSFMDLWRNLTGGAEKNDNQESLGGGIFDIDTAPVSDNPGEAAANTMAGNLKPITDNLEGYSDEAKDSDGLRILMDTYRSFFDIYSTVMDVREQNSISQISSFPGSMVRTGHRNLAQQMKERGAFDDQHPNARIEASLPEYTEEMMLADQEMRERYDAVEKAKAPVGGLMSPDEVRNLPVNQIERPTITFGPPEDDEGNPIAAEDYVPDAPYAQFLKDEAAGMYDVPPTGRLFLEDVERIEARRQQPGANVDFQFIRELEGGNRLDMYIPRNKNGQIVGSSGPTIGTGIDIGQMRERDMDGLPEELQTKLRPYLNMTGQTAQNFVAANPLTLSNAETDTLNAFVKDRIINTLIEKFDAASSEPFFKLTQPQATALMSVAFQYGSNKPTETYPNFWKAVTEGDWAAAEAELRDFNDDYASRRIKEADLLAGN